MPYLSIALSQPLPEARRAAIAAALTAAMQELLGKRREVTAVRFAETAPGAWFVDGDAVAGLHAYVDIKITRGTNTVAQKAVLLARVRAVMQPLLEPSYVVIDEVDADAWGYDGTSQASRLFADMSGSEPRHGGDPRRAGA